MGVHIAWVSEVRRRLLFLFQRRQFERDLEAEMRLHLELKAQQNRLEGLDPEEALYAARRRFGNPVLLAERSRDQWNWNWLDDLVRDARYAVRNLRRSPGFTAVVLLTLALGIGANTAIFSVLRGAWLAPARYAQSERLVDISMIQLTGNRFSAATSYANFADWKAQSRVFESIGVHQMLRYANVTAAGEAEEVCAHRFSADLLRVLGVPPLLGRWFEASEDASGGPRSVLLQHAWCQRRFGGDPSVLGKRISIDGESFTIVGVMPPHFEFPPLWAAWTPAVWLSLNLPPEALAARGDRRLSVAGRLKPGISLDQAQAEMTTIAGRLQAAWPKENGGWGIKLSGIHDNRLLEEVLPTLRLLMAAAGLVLLIACANIANLLLAREAVREKEYAVRRALGVSRWRLTRQILTETGLLSLAGGAIGILVAWWTLPSLKVLLPRDVPRVDGIALDGAVLAFALGASLLTGFAFGLVQALRTGSGGLDAVLRQGSRTLSARNRFGKMLVSVEVALAVVLLAGAGLLIESFWRLSGVDLGFERDRVLTMRLQLPKKSYPTGARVMAFRDELLRRISALPGVERAGTVSSLPMGVILQGTDFEIEGRPETAARMPSVSFANVSGEYHRAMGIPLLRGRHFNETDRPGAIAAAIVTDSVGRAHWPDSDAVGRRIRISRLDTRDWFTIVGVVKDVRERRPEKTTEGAIYVLDRQLPAKDQGKTTARLIVAAIRTATPAAVARAAKAAVAEIDKDQPVADLLTMDQIVGRHMAGRRLNMALISLFAGLALALAAVGVFGVVSYSVARRTNEIGIRMALGAPPAAVLAMVMRESSGMALFGAAAGIAGAVSLSRLLIAFLYGVKPAAPHILTAAAALLVAVVLIAAWFPARRAMRVDPLAALRAE